LLGVVVAAIGEPVDHQHPQAPSAARGDTAPRSSPLQRTRAQPCACEACRDPCFGHTNQ
jgi:hypothetical protein